jgi:hypothetical protein
MAVEGLPEVVTIFLRSRRRANPAFALHEVADLRLGWSRAGQDIALEKADGRML